MSLELVYMNLCGPKTIRSRGGKRYVFLLVDDYTRFSQIIFLIHKEDALDTFSTLIKKHERKLVHQLIAIRSDHGTEFENVKLINYCSSHGLDHNFSTARTPQQNGVTERKNRTLQKMARSMMQLVILLVNSGLWP